MNLIKIINECFNHFILTFKNIIDDFNKTEDSMNKLKCVLPDNSNLKTVRCIIDITWHDVNLILKQSKLSNDAYKIHDLFEEYNNFLIKGFSVNKINKFFYNYIIKKYKGLIYSKSNS